MSETKHTQGPWGVEFVRWAPEQPVQGFAITAPGKVMPLASAGCSVPNKVLIVSPELQHLYGKELYTSEEVEANAHLLGAAKDLLAVCEAVVLWFSKGGIETRDGGNVPEEAMAAIAKAKGEAA